MKEDISEDIKGEYLSLEDFKKEYLESVNEEEHLKREDDLVTYTFDVAYLLYLVKAEYAFNYHDDSFHYLNKDCHACLGRGVVKHKEKLVNEIFRIRQC